MNNVSPLLDDYLEDLIYCEIFKDDSLSFDYRKLVLH